MKLNCLVYLSPLVFTGCVSFFSTPPKVVRDVPYKTVDNNALTADVYIPPKKPGPHPAVLVVHGGSWSKRSGDMTSICKKLALEGFVAINLTYSLAPKYLFPQPIEDIRDAARFFMKNANQYNIDPQRVSAWGYSAGANLILMAGLDAELGLKALVAGGTPADLTQWPKSPIVTTYIGSSYEQATEKWKQASPVNVVNATSPPVFMYHGSWDKLVEIEQMHLMEKALKEKGRPVTTYTATFLGHVATYLLSFGSENQAVEFLKASLK